MKESFLNMSSSLRYVFFSILMSLFIFYGCGEDEPTGPGFVIAPINISTIIFSPKSPAPGDTVTLTAVITSDSLNPEFPTISWAATGGILIDTDQVSVRWEAPMIPGFYSVTVSARNSVSSSTRVADILVNTAANVVPSRAGEIHITSTGDSVYYLTSDVLPTSPAFRGFLVSLYTKGGGTVPVTSNFPGNKYAFAKDLSHAAHTVERALGGGTVENPINVFLDNLQTGAVVQITDTGPDQERNKQFTDPAFSPDGNVIAFELFEPAPVAGGTDTFDVAIYNRTLDQVFNVTRTHGDRRRNFFPTFSSDGNWLVFLSNRTGDWELYELPVTGGTVPLDSASVVKITDSGGLYGGGLVQSVPLHAWNPNPAFSVLAIEDATSKLHIVDPSIRSDFTVPVSGDPSSLAWSPSGEGLAIVTGGSLYLLNYLGGQPGNLDLVAEVARRGDIIADVSWSRSGEYLVYRYGRSAMVWYEIVDISGAAGFVGPVIVTPTISSGNLADYSPRMSIRPQWGVGAEIYFLYFDSTTPSLRHLDLSGSLP